MSSSKLCRALPLFQLWPDPLHARKPTLLLDELRILRAVLSPRPCQPKLPCDESLHAAYARMTVEVPQTHVPYQDTLPVSLKGEVPRECLGGIAYDKLGPVISMGLGTVCGCRPRCDSTSEFIPATTSTSQHCDFLNPSSFAPTCLPHLAILCLPWLAVQ